MSIGTEKVVELKKARRKEIKEVKSQRGKEKNQIKEKIKAKIKIDRESIPGTILELLVNRFGVDEGIERLSEMVNSEIELSLFLDLLFSKRLKRNNNCKVWYHLNQDNLIFFKEHTKELEIIEEKREKVLLTRSLKELKRLGFIEYKINNNRIGFSIKAQNIIN